MSSCCGPKPSHKNKKFDPIFHGSLTVVAFFYILHALSNMFSFSLPFVQTFSQDVYMIMNTMWWGLMLGILFVGVVGSIPRELIMSALGKGGTIQGIMRATLAGVMLDVCSHGVLMVGAKLYERGASLGQVMAFLIASPWNSLSLMLILWAMIGLEWMLIFLVLSMIIGFVSGIIFDVLVKRGTLEENSNTFDLPADFDFKAEAKTSFKTADKSFSGFVRMIKSGAHDARIVIKWLMFGIVLASLVRSVMSDDMFATYFGATLLGLGVTALAATVIEVCSEGSVPIAADIFNKADAKGNSFAFLMAGVSTDYTEIMVLKETFGGWKRALFLPLITLPQILVWAFAINQL